MAFFNKLFSRNTKEEENTKKDLLLQNIQESISDCDNDIKKSKEEIKKIKKWIAEVIHEHFFVPNDFWYEEMVHYNEIKGNEENKSIAIDKITKCDEIISEYESQVKFRKTKIKLNEMTIAKFEESKQKIIDLDSGKNLNNDADEKIDSFQKHKSRLDKLQEESTTFEDNQKPQKQLENIIENVNELIENHEIEEEVKSFMIKLNEQFNSEMKNYDQNRLINEMEKLIEQYKLKK